jgi:chromosome partitioning protein
MKMKRAITLVIANHKGGVGKTTSAVNLATGLAGFGYPTVLVDCDGQGNVAQFLALERRPALYELVIQEKAPAAVLQRVEGYPLLGVVTGNQDTLEIEHALNTGRRFQAATAIRNALRPFLSRNGNGKPTVVVIDTAPSLSAIQVSALNAADWLIIPASPEYASETGISQMVQAVADLQAAGGNLNLLGILPTMVDFRSNEHKQTLVELRTSFPDLVLPPVRRRIAIAEAPRAGRPIWDYNGVAANDYGLALSETISRTGLA